MGPVGGIPMTAPKDVGRCKTWLKTTKACRGAMVFYRGKVVDMGRSRRVSLGKKCHFLGRTQLPRSYGCFQK